MDTSRIRWIDGTRGLAALAVAVFHYQRYFAPTGFLPGGALNVDLFFILSGYVLTHVYRDGLQSGVVSWGVFVRNRVARLWPLNVFAIVAAAAVYFVLMSLMSVSSLNPNSTLSTAIGSALLLQGTGLLPFHPWVGPSWSISTEVATNFMWCAVLVYGAWSRRLAVCVVVGSVAMLLLVTPIDPQNGTTFLQIHEQPFLPMGVVRTAMGFSLGCLMYDAPRLPDRLARLLAPGALAIIVWIETTYSPAPGRALVEAIAIFIAFPLLVWSCSSADGIVTRILSTPLLRGLGLISFSIYLLHQSAGDLMTLLIYCGVGINVPEVGAIYLATLLLGSTLTYLFVELPCDRMIRRTTWLERQLGRKHFVGTVAGQQPGANQRRLRSGRRRISQIDALCGGAGHIDPSRELTVSSP